MQLQKVAIRAHGKVFKQHIRTSCYKLNQEDRLVGKMSEDGENLCQKCGWTNMEREDNDR